MCIVKVTLCKRDLIFASQIHLPPYLPKIQVILMKQDLMHCHCIRFRTHKFNQKSSAQSIRAGRVSVLMVGLRLELLGTNIYWEFMALYVSQQLKSAFSTLSP